jgi:hypothetical protein
MIGGFVRKRLERRREFKNVRQARVLGLAQ